ncbi:MAG TPA: tetrahydromethanopterin S-methyltransferase subunit E [Methanoculleus sp.]|mgnify:FL=1|jgi:tetrahydromethanopterin S-methyltransferase subunit E|nr:tetrahydromethanopterin S-methyltransferase subunit E [Methanoculleus sp.]MBP8675780.1 tetrahydromethanopterin S-methyltransferase subunit E [Methanoculleus sp.]HON41164.1 tetrahydromethanopterin S-methyltransferase subunit E [Methanoculleus sp.]HRD24851.1 tetrahydromethanopterin S-methyltransferase subunit E [Methanoculleus sp.]HRT11556.1 tetrahydromethanopterin S-methyltransferase subunit E [Methanoculleus sp.]
MEEIIFGIGITALAGALATIAGAAEDTESDIGSQGDPNSQVQLAPQMGYVHRIFNKAIAGEPPAYGLWVALGAGLAWAFMAMQINPILAIVLGSALAVFVQGVYATTAYLGRTASLSKFEQPVYVDILKSMTTVTMAHAFVAIFATVTVCHLMNGALGHPFPLPLLGLIWGIALGAAGSATGNPFYGKERQYQNQAFGAGVPIAASGNIVRYAEAGQRNSIDNGFFSAKLGGPASGICFGLIVFFELWRTVVFEPVAAGWGAILVGVVVILIFAIIDRYIEVWARKTFGPYVAPEEASS